MRNVWSRYEIETVVSDYLLMLDKELRGELYSKTVHRRNLSGLLDNRSEGSIERKHQNISAVMIKLGYPYISGYKPLGNFQALLAEIVSEWVDGDQTLADSVSSSVVAPAKVPSVEDILARLEVPPVTPTVKREMLHETSQQYVWKRPAVNYLEREARNASLGKAGEQFIVNYERARLMLEGKDSLAENVEHVAVTEGDGAGFDIRSFDVDGSDRFIEVKTTSYGKQTPFFVTGNELFVSRECENRYYLYRLFDFRADPRLYTLSGALDKVCALEPVQFTAHVR
ncbi:MAG: DUF3883 domain-containing protein [bacterium]|nr:DUF3883 domain-containing protein [bacterium]